ncbi:hypothetical protein CQW23_00099 [Capsicum baccatum]|uniref:BAH domain-containing protein n=1 Tax=Capsicum baccatum TaxID=33114 RepID=A0A2G2XJR9_CAPBA|nr:hypothetical protein CQW23_00099 [Capsicum baccatum]
MKLDEKEKEKPPKTMQKEEERVKKMEEAKEDLVLLVPEAKNQKPYVAIIKDISQTKDGNMMVTGQWFYQPEGAIKRDGGNWQTRDARELFFSFQRDEIPAESVMQKCVVHFVPLNKQIPKRKEHPGYFVQKVYDAEQRTLFKLTNEDYEDTKQHEIDLLIGQPIAETPGSFANNASEYFFILSNFKVLTGETQRDKWLEKLLQWIQYFCNPVDNVLNDGKEKGGSDAADLTGNTDSAKHVNESLDNSADRKALSSDFQKYNQKMRQLTFNLKFFYVVNYCQNASLLARRLLKGALDPSQILNMSQNELKIVLNV